MNKYIGEWYFGDIIAHIDKFELGTKIRSESGDIYNLSQAEGEGKQRKFSRWNGTRLRFMTYENIRKKFEILENNTEEIEPLNVYKLMEAPYMANKLKEQNYDTFMEHLKQSEVEIANKIIEIIDEVNKMKEKDK